MGWEEEGGAAAPPPFVNLSEIIVSLFVGISEIFKDYNENGKINYIYQINFKISRYVISCTMPQIFGPERLELMLVHDRVENETEHAK